MCRPLFDWHKLRIVRGRIRDEHRDFMEVIVARASVRQKLLLFLLSASITAALVFQVVAGQTPAAPSVNVIRNSALWENVWPGDFNGDGKTDLVASDTSVGGNPPVLLVVL